MEDNNADPSGGYRSRTALFEPIPQVRSREKVQPPLKVTADIIDNHARKSAMKTGHGGSLRFNWSGRER